MFDGLFKPKFYTKCKLFVKITKTRVDTVKRKKNSVCKYLKNDIVDLLKNSLDYNAYGRAQGLIEEKRRLACYEFLEQFCICVASNVSLLQKSSGCPDECREAISSLVYAAARVSEVPELRDLRSLFAERYGNTLEEFVNPEFVERFKAEAPSKEMKVELLVEIAREYSIKWDAKSLEQRLYTPPHHTEAEEAKTKSDEPKTRSRLSFHSREESLDESNTSMMSTSEEDSMSTSGSCVTGSEEDPETKAFYYGYMPSKPKIEKQESLPEKMTKSDLMDTESPSAGKPKPRSVRRRFAKPPPEAEATKESKKVRSDSMEKGSGEGIRRMSRRTSSWQPKPSTIPDFDEVWKAQLVLSDFVLHKICTSSQFHGIVSLELGAGTGLLGILLAPVAKAVFLTDHGHQILDNCAKNVQMNSSLFSPQAVLNVRELNWTTEWPIQHTHGDPDKCSWSSQDLEQVKSARFIFAADVIYSDDLTIALFSMLKRVMSFGRDKVLYLGLEKRYNFSLGDLNVVANGYDCFRSYITEDGLCEQEKRSFVGKRIDVELWKIKYVL